MITIQKKVVIDENGNPTAVIIPWEEFKVLEEVLGLDLDDQTREELVQAKKDRMERKAGAYIEIDAV